MTPVESKAQVVPESSDNGGQQNWQVVPFGLRLFFLEDEMMPGQGASPPTEDGAAADAQGIVGTITIFNKSVLIWFGWGKLQTKNNDESDAATATASSSNQSRAGTATSLSMGPLMVGMPRTKYQGAFGNTGSTGGGGYGTSSKLVGCDSDEDESTAQAMAARLATKLSTTTSGVSVLVSCKLRGQIPLGIGGVGSMGDSAQLMEQQAAAHAEKEIHRLLKTLLK